MLKDAEFSHFGIFCHDVERMADFYKRLFGLLETDRGGNDTTLGIFLSRKPGEHHQIALVSGRVDHGDEKIIQQISFRLPTLDDLRDAKRLVDADHEAALISSSNHIMSFSLYVSDPEGNRLELFVDSPFYALQPKFFPLDLDRSDEEIYAEIREKVGDDPSFQSFDTWKSAFNERLTAGVE